MECPCCGDELEYDCCFGRLAAHQDGKVLGDIYWCPNGREDNGKCESSMFHVAGSFYVYSNDPSNLLEGYPC